MKCKPKQKCSGTLDQIEECEDKKQCRKDCEIENEGNEDKIETCQKKCDFIKYCRGKPKEVTKCEHLKDC